MARAENQGLQIALIVFVMLTIVLAVVTFLYVRNYQEAIAANTQLQKTATDNKKLADSAQAEINNIKERLGVAVEMPEEKVKSTFEEDMKNFAATLPADKQHYRYALESLWNTNQELAADNTELQNNRKQLQDQLKLRDEERDAQIQKFSKQAEDSARDTAEERAKFDDARKSLTATSEEMNGKIVEKDNQYAQLQETSARQQQGLQSEMKTISTAKDLLEDKIKGYEKAEFEMALGNVVLVNSERRGTSFAYINLGSADMLPPLMTFSVYDELANTSIGEGLKGRLEVTQVLGEHLAMTRILDEDHANPIAAGDKIYTSLWKPGQTLHFAILGLFDLDNDGADDRAILRDLITSTGGIIDAEMDNAGKISGEMDINTRYLIEGTTPKDRNAIDGKAKMVADADRAGVERITATRFLEQAGWKDPRQVVKFGRNGTRERIQNEAFDKPVPTAQPKTEANFQKRRPWNPKDSLPKKIEDKVPEKK